MTRNEMISKYAGREWTAPNGETRVYLDLDPAMPRRNISRTIRNSVKVWLDEHNVIQYKAPASEIPYLAEVIADAETICEETETAADAAAEETETAAEAAPDATDETPAAAPKARIEWRYCIIAEHAGKVMSLCGTSLTSNIHGQTPDEAIADVKTDDAVTKAPADAKIWVYVRGHGNDGDCTCYAERGGPVPQVARDLLAENGDRKILTAAEAESFLTGVCA